MFVYFRVCLPPGQPGRDGGRRQELHGEAERGLHAHAAQHGQRVVLDLQCESHNWSQVVTYNHKWLFNWSQLVTACSTWAQLVTAVTNNWIISHVFLLSQDNAFSTI